MLRRWLAAVSLGLIAACSGGAAPSSANNCGAATATGGVSSNSSAENAGGMSSSQAGSPGTGGSVAANSGGSWNTASGGTVASTGGIASTATGGIASTSTGGIASTSTGGKNTIGGSSSSASGGTDVVGHPGPPYTYPQNNRSNYCSYPVTAHSGDAKATYATWKTKLVSSDGAGGFQRVLRPDNENNATNTTVSEGIGYGMILAVIMDDQTLFDNLWKYSQIHTNSSSGLMIWLIDASGNAGIEDVSTNRAAVGSATDADEDMAWALALAAQKWAGRGSLATNYLDLAKAQITRIWNSEVDHSGVDLINAGDSWGSTFAWNPSYFAPNEYRAFAKLDTANATGWGRIIDKGYTILAASQNTTTGLFPAWTNASGSATAPWSGAPTQYQYDAARVPFRVGLDYCDYGEPRAKTLLAKTNAFFSNIGAASIVDGYSLTGSPTAENTSPTGVQSALFVGAAGVGAMSNSTYQPFVNDVYARLVTQPDELMLPKSYYFNLSWKVFSLLMMSGNVFDYSLHP